MKNTYIIILCAFILTGCGDEFLELAPLSENTTGNFYRNANDIELATVAIYDAYGTNQLQNSLRILKETRSDNAEFDLANTDINAGDVDDFVIVADNSAVERVWTIGYRTIQLANIVISRVDALDFSQSLKDQYKGEALFLRALVYFDLVRFFGDVPLSLKELSTPQEAFDLGRENTQVIYTQIKDDLTNAISFLPEKGDLPVGRATKGAARTLLGKVHLTLDEFSEAENVLSQVTGYSLLSSYVDVFEVANANSDESIFELQYTEGEGTESGFCAELTPWGSANAIFGEGSDGGGNILPTDELLNSFASNDERRIASFDTVTLNGLFVEYTAKSTNLPPVDFTSADNFIVFRYADVLLMRAEARTQRGSVQDSEALNFINEVRARAGLDNLTSIDANALLDERRWELSIEGERWYDLIRFGEAINVMAAVGKTVSQNQLLYPIPDREIQIYGLPQNPGY